MTEYSPKSVQQAWDNHFAAFGAQDLDRILLDYVETSVVKVFDKRAGKLLTFVGLQQIRECFSGLFSKLSDLSTLAAPVVEVTEDPKQVFLIWKCPGCGVEESQDTFLLDDRFKITRQNVLIGSTPYEAKSVQDAWDNHFTAFGAQDLDRVLLDYTDDSVLKIFHSASKKLATYKGRAEIRKAFSGLFAMLTDLSTLSAPVCEVTEDPKHVFLIWTCPGQGFDFCQDTFIFDDNNRIVRQNVIVTGSSSAAPPSSS